MHVTDLSRELWGAAFAGNARKVERLLEAGALVNEPDESGRILLIEVAGVGASEVVPILVRAGADVHAVDNYWHDNALIVAAREGYPEAVRALIDAGADVNLANKHYSTALSAACGHDAEENLQILEMLIAAGADVNAGRNVTVLMEASRNGNPAMIRALVAAGANVNATTAQGTALIQAVRKGRTENVAALLEMGADRKLRAPADSAFKEFAGKTAFEVAVATQCDSVICMLR